MLKIVLNDVTERARVTSEAVLFGFAWNSWSINRVNIVFMKTSFLVFWRAIAISFFFRRHFYIAARHDLGQIKVRE